MKTISCLTLKLLDSQWCNQNFFQDQDQYQDLTFKTKTKPSVRDLDQDFPSQDQDQDQDQDFLWCILEADCEVYSSLVGIVSKLWVIIQERSVHLVNETEFCYQNENLWLVRPNAKL